ncbi:MAG: Gfo/Idh/MocA family oxidoreductase [Verrucomicrobia bacterium]|nr:Gfo/Idh/MocA family oxidoreductase [Verrucomicrobiota bacterium]
MIRKVIRGLFIGCGRMGRSRLMGFSRELGTEVAGLVDPSSAALSATEASRGVPSFSSVDTALRSISADVAFIASPNCYHAEQFLACANRGMHVWCEKPVALNLEDVIAMRDAAKQMGVKVATGYGALGLFYLHDAIEFVRAGKAGRLVQALSNKMGGAGFCSAGTSHYAVRDPKSSGGWILHCLCHEVDWAMQIGGEVESVCCETVTTVPDPEPAQEEAVTAILRFKSGGTATLLENQLDHKYHRYAVVGEFGGYFADRFVRANGAKMPALVRETVNRGKVEREEWSAVAYEREAERRPSLLRRFLDAIRGDLPSPVPLERSVEVIRVCLALRQAAGTGEWVKVSRKKEQDPSPGF